MTMVMMPLVMLTRIGLMVVTLIKILVKEGDDFDVDEGYIRCC